MDSFLFILNSALFPLSLCFIAYKIRQKRKLTSISDFTETGKFGEYFLFFTIFLGNLIQAVFSIQLFYVHHFPDFILLSALAGALGVIVATLRINEHKFGHIFITTLAIALYTVSLIFTSLTLENSYLLLISISLLIILIVGWSFKIRLKYLEVFYFIIFGIWNLLVIFIISPK